MIFHKRSKTGLLSVRPTPKLVQMQHWGNFKEAGWSAYGPSHAHRHHPELKWDELWLPEHGNQEVDQQDVGENHVDGKQHWHNGILCWTTLEWILAPDRLIASAATHILTCNLKRDFFLQLNCFVDQGKYLHRTHPYFMSSMLCPRLKTHCLSSQYLALLLWT